jgi:hypothetical protein
MPASLDGTEVDRTRNGSKSLKPTGAIVRSRVAEVGTSPQRPPCRQLPVPHAAVICKRDTFLAIIASPSPVSPSASVDLKRSRGDGARRFPTRARAVFYWRATADQPGEESPAVGWRLDRPGGASCGRCREPGRCHTATQRLRRPR